MVTLELKDGKVKHYKDECATVLIRDPSTFTQEGDLKYILVNTVIADDGAGLAGVMAVYDAEIDAYKLNVKMGTETKAAEFKVKADAGNTVIATHESVSIEWQYYHEDAPKYVNLELKGSQEDFDDKDTKFFVWETTNADGSIKDRSPYMKLWGLNKGTPRAELGLWNYNRLVIDELDISIWGDVVGKVDRLSSPLGEFVLTDDGADLTLTGNLGDLTVTPLGDMIIKSNKTWLGAETNKAVTDKALIDISKAGNCFVHFPNTGAQELSLQFENTEVFKIDATSTHFANRLLKDINIGITAGGAPGCLVYESGFITYESWANMAMALEGFIDHKNLNGLQGGQADQYYHLTSSEHTELTEWLDDVVLSNGGSIDLGTGNVTATFPHAVADHDKYLVDHGGIIKYRTGTELITDIIADLNHNDLAGIQGGQAGQRYHLNSSEHTELSAWLDDVVLSNGGDVDLVLGDLTAVDGIFSGDVDVTGNINIKQQAGVGSYLYMDAPLGQNTGVAWKENGANRAHAYYNAGSNFFRIYNDGNVNVIDLYDTGRTDVTATNSQPLNLNTSNLVTSCPFLKFTAGAAPAVPAEGHLWADDANNTIKYYDGASWLDLVGGGGHWSRVGTTLSPATAGDDVSLDGDLDVLGGLINLGEAVTDRGILNMGTGSVGYSSFQLDTAEMMRFYPAFIYSYRDFRPSSDGVFDLGTTSRQWNNFYASGNIYIGRTAAAHSYLFIDAPTGQNSAVTFRENGANRSFMFYDATNKYLRTYNAQNGTNRMDLYDDGKVYLVATDSQDILLQVDVGKKVSINRALMLENGTAIDEFSTDDTLVGNSDDAVPTEKAIKTYVDGQVGGITYWSRAGTTLSTATAGDNLNITGDHTDGTDNIKVSEVAGLLSWESANKAWYPCMKDASTSGPQVNFISQPSAHWSNYSVGTYIVYFTLPLPTVKDGLNLYIDAIRIGLSDADNNNYVTYMQLAGSTATGGGSIRYNDARNVTTVKEEEYVFGASQNMSAYGRAEVSVHIVTDTQYALDITQVRVRCWYQA